MKNRALFAAALLIVLTGTTLPAQDGGGDYLDARLLVIGQGDPVYSFWGHTGIAIKDMNTGKDVFFDFGNFYFQEENFFTNFALGRMLYIAYATYTEPYIRTVLMDDRRISEYELNLSPAAKRDMLDALIYKSRPENRTYLYHHYNDNCSTRIRDYIDIAVNGQLKEKTESISRTTFRRSFLRFTTQSKAVGWALSLLQGMPIDNKVTLWQEMYLPSVLEEVVKDFTYIDDRGKEVPLVLSSEIINEVPDRPAVPAEYMPPWLQLAATGLLLGAAARFAGRRAVQGKRALYALMNILAGLIIGLTGSAILFLMTFTDHTYAYDNLNIFMINPLALFVIPAAVLYWIKGDGWEKRIRLLWRIQFGAALLMILIKALTPLHQDNLMEIMVFLPFLAALSFPRKKVTAEAP